VAGVGVPEVYEDVRSLAATKFAKQDA